MSKRTTARVATVAAAGAAAMVMLIATPAPDVANTATFTPAMLRPFEAPQGRVSIPLAGRRWNVVVVMTDDQIRDMTLDMPHLRRLITTRGVQYPNAFVQTSTCCPSRASFLTGDFISGHGVQDNEATGGPGGYRVFRERGNEKRTIALQLKRAGYTTGLFGKYLNEYGAVYRGGKPPGWDTWRAFTALTPSKGYRGFTATYPRSKKKPALVKTRFANRYSTRWAGNQAVEFIRRAPRRKPVFAVYTPFAPHGPAVPEPKYRGTLADDGWWLQHPAFHETDVSDKPLWVQRKVRTQFPDGGRFSQLAVRQRETLRTVDDQIANIVAALRKTGRWNRTLFVFMSDNGLMNGVHAERSKYVPYRRATEVPLMIRYGRDRRPVTDPRPVAANVDVTATILALAGRTGRLARIDGKPLARGPARTGVPLAGSQRDGDGWAQRPPYCGWRTAAEMYVRYGSGEEEYYDYTTDPYELTNLAGDPVHAQKVARLRQEARKACTEPPTGYGPSFDQPSWTYRQKGEPPRVKLYLPGGYRPLPGVAHED